MPKQTPGEILDRYVPDLPKRFYAFVVRALIFLLTFRRKVKFTYNFDKKRMKRRQVVILADHSSTDNYLYAIRGYPFVQPNVIMGYQNMFGRGLFRLLMKAGAVPKRLYVPDISTAISVLRLVRKGASVMIFPEGIQSMAGSTQPINPSTAALIKKLGLPVVLCKSRGAYLNRPRFDRSYRNGRMEFSYELLFDADELSKTSEESIYTKLLGRFSYNDFLWNEKAKNVYRGKHKNAYGLDRILFICPVCGRRYGLRVEGDGIVCGCGNAVRVDERYSLIPYAGSSLPFRRIDEWFLWQRGVIRSDVIREDYSLSYDAEYLTLDTSSTGDDRCRKLGEGTVVIDRERFLYSGSKNGKETVISIPVKNIPSAPFVSGRANEFFRDKEYFRFVPKGDKRITVEVLLAIEEIHNLTDEAWRKVSSDVYKTGDIT